MKDVTTLDPDKKVKMLNTIIPEDSLTEKAYRTSIASVMKMNVSDVTSQHVVELMTRGTTTIQNRQVTMT